MRKIQSRFSFAEPRSKIVRFCGVKLTVAVLATLVAAGCAQQTTKPTSSKGLQRIHFDFDQALVKQEDQNILKSNADWMKSHSNAKVVVEGNCDERGTDEYNIALGDRRASAAKKYLVNLGVTANRLSTVSYGEEKPIATCHDESCWSQNRRDEFVAK